MITGRYTRTPGAPPARDFHAARALLFALLFACACAEAAAQPGAAQRPPPDAAPPPMRYLPAETRSRLEQAARDLKGRTRLSMELAEARLASAAAHADADRFDAATLELGVYEAIVQDAVAFIRQSGRSSGKARDRFKQIELALRAHVPRLETLRRSLPSQHAVHVQSTLDFVRDTRAEVLDSFFDDTVVPARPAAKGKPPEAERATDEAQPGREKKPADQR